MSTNGLPELPEPSSIKFGTFPAIKVYTERQLIALRDAAYQAGLEAGAAKERERLLALLAERRQNDVMSRHISARCALDSAMSAIRAGRE